MSSPGAPGEVHLQLVHLPWSSWESAGRCPAQRGGQDVLAGGVAEAHLLHDHFP